jgi:hypothetical protein
MDPAIRFLYFYFADGFIINLFTSSDIDDVADQDYNQHFNADRQRCQQAGSGFIDQPRKIKSAGMLFCERGDKRSDPSRRTGNFSSLEWAQFACSRYFDRLTAAITATIIPP